MRLIMYANGVGSTWRFKSTPTEDSNFAHLRELTLQLTEKDSALKESERKYRNLFNNSVAAIFIFDTIHGNILDANSAFYHMLQIPRGENLLVGDIICGSGIDFVHSVCNTSQGGGNCKNVFQYFRRDGEIVRGLTCSTYVKEVDQVECVVIDITQMHKAHEELIKISALQKTILEQSPIAIGMLSNRVFKWVNGAFMRLLLYKENEIVGNVSRFLYPSEEEFTRVGDELYTDIKPGEYRETQTKWVRSNGTTFDCIVRISPVEGTGDVPLGESAFIIVCFALEV